MHIVFLMSNPMPFFFFFFTQEENRKTLSDVNTITGALRIVPDSKYRSKSVDS